MDDKGWVDYKLNEAQKLAVKKLSDSLNGFCPHEIVEIMYMLTKESREYKEYEKMRQKSDRQMYQSWPKEDNANYW